jgi:hypothetical protein
MTISPTEKPRLSSTELHGLLQPYTIDRSAYPLVVVGIRGYYKNTMGAPGVNDRGIYDDAIFLDTAQATVAFNGNTDPSSYRKGKGKGSEKGMASLNPGAWFVHKFDLHKGKYLASLPAWRGCNRYSRRRPSLPGHRIIRNQHS